VSGAAQARAAAAGSTGGAARSGDVLGSVRRADDASSNARSVGGARAEGNGAATGAAVAAGGSGNAASARPGAAIEVTPDSWNTMLTQLEISGLARQLANNCVLIGRKGALVRLGLDPRNNMMRVPGAVDKLTQALSKYFGEAVRIEFEASIAGAETPAQAEKRAVVQELDNARQSLETDPAVRALRETFGATLLPDSVRPLK
jgi:DNA polymerase-3 subunit gamma/tau